MFCVCISFLIDVRLNGVILALSWWFHNKALKRILVLVECERWPGVNPSYLPTYQSTPFKDMCCISNVIFMHMPLSQSATDPSPQPTSAHPQKKKRENILTLPLLSYRIPILSQLTLHSNFIHFVHWLTSNSRIFSSNDIKLQMIANFTGFTFTAAFQWIYKCLTHKF